MSNPISNFYGDPQYKFSVPANVERELESINPAEIIKVEREGFNPALGTARETIAAMGSQYPWPAGLNAVEMFVQGSDANDVPGGSGTEQIIVHSITVNGDDWELSKNTYNMQGAGKFSIGNHLALLLAETATSNLLVDNNLITIEDAGGGTVYGRINAGIGCTQHCIHVVPTGYRFALLGIDVGMGESNQRIETYLRVHRPGFNTWQTIKNYTGVGTLNPVNFPLLTIFEEKTLLDFQALVSVGNSHVSATMFGLMWPKQGS